MPQALADTGAPLLVVTGGSPAKHHGQELFWRSQFAGLCKHNHFTIELPYTLRQNKSEAELRLRGRLITDLAFCEGALQAMH